MTTWSTWSGFTQLRCSAAVVAIAPSSSAERSASLPKPGVPTYSAMAVRAPERMTRSFMVLPARRSRVLSLAGEFRRPLFEEGLHALVAVVRAREQPEEGSLEVEAVPQRHVAAVVDGVQREAHRHRAHGQDLAHELLGLGQQLRLG